MQHARAHEETTCTGARTEQQTAGEYLREQAAARKLTLMSVAGNELRTAMKVVATNMRHNNQAGAWIYAPKDDELFGKELGSSGTIVAHGACRWELIQLAREEARVHGLYLIEPRSTDGKPYLVLTAHEDAEVGHFDDEPDSRDAQVLRFGDLFRPVVAGHYPQVRKTRVDKLPVHKTGVHRALEEIATKEAVAAGAFMVCLTLMLVIGACVFTNRTFHHEASGIIGFANHNAQETREQLASVTQRMDELLVLIKKQSAAEDKAMRTRLHNAKIHSPFDEQEEWLKTADECADEWKDMAGKLNRMAEEYDIAMQRV